METKELSTQTKKELRILWVEDEDVIRENVGLLIELTGHKCDLVSNGKTALEFLDKHTYDLVVTDIGMHGMNGWEVAKIIKEKYDGKMTVAVASGWIISEEEKNEFGIKYVLTKPFTFLQLKKLFIDLQ